MGKDQMKRSGADQAFVNSGNAGKNDWADDDNDAEEGNKKAKKKKDEYEDEQVWEEDGVMGSRFGHQKEMVSYGEMDEEDEAVANESIDVDNTIIEEDAVDEVAHASDEESDDSATNI